MKHLAVLLFSLFSIFIITSCTKGGCDDCTAQKKEFCRILKENNCNSAAMTYYIEQLNTGCGKDEANAYIATATGECKTGTLICPECE
jgi:hypothetical protein